MIFEVITLFPDLFRSPLEVSLLAKAREKGIITVNLISLRDYGEGRHKVTDDYPYGGGGGMVMKPGPIVRAIRDVRSRDPRTWVILLTPQGVPFTQQVARRLSSFDHIALICGRYEGVDERVRCYVDEELSIGDYVLSGGEVPALVIIEAVARLVPGVLGREEAPEKDSFVDHLLEHPHYTRPQEFEGKEVPEVLLSGDHARVRRWRREMSLLRTWIRRPELLDRPLREDEELFLKRLQGLDPEGDSR
ncbi:MAG: tRNA (guanosine(37)-N1)-methyltransferase TrmD [Deltaproteobacteria bacterium]|nr:MAG: tRNA (guanosine(37)-N1)-methyltransferase TrmD [Deltaproteobacteria bacterium]